jgi:hypothetical protein
MAAARSALASAGRVANEAVSFVVFVLLDALEVLLCGVYKVADYVAEGAWRPCYCSSSAEAAAPGKIVVSERGGSKVVSVLSNTKVHLEDISDTLYTRPSVLSGAAAATSPPSSSYSVRASASAVTVHSAIVQILRGKAGAGDGEHKPYPSPRWSDCHCANCNPADTDRLFVHVEGPPGTYPYIHRPAINTEARDSLVSPRHPLLKLKTAARRRRTCCSSTGSSRRRGSGRRRCCRT